MKFNLELPLDHIYITQPFGVNFVDFYTKLGMKGHNGADFRINRSWPVRAAHRGRVTHAGEQGGYGIEVRIETENLKTDNGFIKFETIYAHLERPKVKVGKWVEPGEEIGIPDNTGMSTGDHLHFGLRLWWENPNGKWECNYNNGYFGWINPAPYFRDKAWDKLPVERRYNREDVFRPENPGWRPWHAWLNEKRVAMELWRALGRRPDNLQIAACTYGGWGREDVENPALFPIWAELKKDEYLAGVKPVLRLGLNSVKF